MEGVVKWLVLLVISLVILAGIGYLIFKEVKDTMVLQAKRDAAVEGVKQVKDFMEEMI